jgi:selenide,water dikinase
VLVLTKPLGTGVLTTAAKAGLLEPKQIEEMTMHMATLNAKAGVAVQATEHVHACTDITGFGLLGHCYEMASGSGVTIRLKGDALPLMSGAADMAKMGIIPGGAYRNMDYVKHHFRMLDTAEQYQVDLAADPQTSGGLLVALPQADAEQLLQKLQPFAPWSAIVGKVLPDTGAAIEVE